MDKGSPVSEQYDDVYFSADDGLAETHHVFVKGNGLPGAWQGRKRFVVGETGFGTGLNFLAVWKMFVETADPDAQLHFVTYEKYPLAKETVAEALSVFRAELGAYADAFLEQYPVPVPGFHRIVFNGQIFLTLIIGDVNEEMPKTDACVDCWFLDGFTPAKNPEMWTDVVFQNMARMSKPGATLATFTAAGDVRRGLNAAGFMVEKRDGFGRKRDMVAGRYPGERGDETIAKQSVAIVGGGLAGTACAYALRRYGYEPVIYESSESLAAGASGNALGLVNPRFSAFRNAESDFYSSGFWNATRVFEQCEKEIDFQPSGALHLMTDEDKAKRLNAVYENWGWHDDLQILDEEAASEVAGIKIKHNALYLKKSCSVNPFKLCRYYADGVEVRTGANIKSLNDLEEEIVVLACGVAAKNFVPWLPVHTVRGQVSEVKATALSSQLRCNLHFGGYMAAARDGAHMVGASFQNWLTHSDVLDEDHADNIARLKGHVPVFAGEEFEVTGGRAALRTSSKDRFPIAGAVPGMEGVYVSTAHGSHGLVTSLAAGHMIADQIAGFPCAQSLEVQKSVSAQRFIDRMVRKGQAIA